MARVGQEMVNAVTGERFVWRHTAASTGGGFTEFDLHLREGAVVAGRHIHPHQREDFRVESGTIRLQIGKSEETLTAGDERCVPAGTPHTWANAGSGDAHVVVRLTPALRSEEFFETFCRFAEAGKLNKRGLPRSPLLLAAWMREYRREAGPPSVFQRLALMPLLAALAPLGRKAALKSEAHA